MLWRRKERKSRDLVADRILPHEYGFDDNRGLIYHFMLLEYYADSQDIQRIIHTYGQFLVLPLGYAYVEILLSRKSHCDSDYCNDSLNFAEVWKPRDASVTTLSELSFLGHLKVSIAVCPL